jgi:hypothetical protein
MSRFYIENAQAFLGQEVTVKGWVYNKRSSGKIKFLILRDGTGLDATIFVPSVDLKFKNDTGHYILVQSEIDLDNYSLSFYFYGTKDGRISNVTKPVITSQTAPPPPLYTDDPNLPVGQIQQTDFEAWGANVYFTRTVTKNNKVIISDKFSSHYQPWQAVYLRGTKTQ